MKDRTVITRKIKRNLERNGLLKRVDSQGMKWKDLKGFLMKYPGATWGGKFFVAWV
jgi:hypothetical protein